MPSSIAPQLAVCSWSLRPSSVEDLIASLNQIGLKKLHLALNPLADDPAWKDAGPRLRDAGFEFGAGMLAYPSEDYSTLETIKKTGGVMPDDAWEDNWRITQRVAAEAGKLGLRLVTFHAGFLPHNQTDPLYKKLKHRLERVADEFGRYGCKLGFETGQEDAATLDAFLTDLNKANVGVNFDPANMILYDKGDPVAALRTLGGRLLQCHLKDANRTATPGQWGTEVAVGSGQVDWKGFFQALGELRFTGHLALEREAGEQRIQDIKQGKDFVLGLAV